ncbi:MAG: ADP-ribosylglycohydrolase family protein [Clostridium sp.]|nr:ADP-ribosylglycohydrolase family protein [Clostridium sp.]MCI7443751.1 ADP-ribosylglycohydrolase family protein [Clostridium sp.]
MVKSLYKKNKVMGGIFGLIIGDAVGVPYEFYEAEKLPEIGKIDMIPPKEFEKSYPDVPYGTYSDDSAQFLCILDSYIQNDSFNIQDIADKISRWLNEGLWAVDNIVFDVGNQTLKAIREFKKGTSPLKSGFIVPNGKGNGSLMRDLGIVLLHKGTEKELIKNSHEQSMITHGHICNQICCALYSLIARNLLLGHEFDDSYNMAVKKLKEVYKLKSDYLEELEDNIISNNLIESGTGYVVDCLKSTFKVIRESNSYEETIKKSIALGNDTDTTAAVAGGLAGIIYGYDNIPKRWIKELRGKENILNIINNIEYI